MPQAIENPSKVIGFEAQSTEPELVNTIVIRSGNWPPQAWA